MNSDTPRTDAIATEGGLGPDYGGVMAHIESTVPAEFARELERENAKLKAGLNQIREIARNSQTQTQSIMKIAMIVEISLSNNSWRWIQA